MPMSAAPATVASTEVIASMRRLKSGGGSIGSFARVSTKRNAIVMTPLSGKSAHARKPSTPTSKAMTAIDKQTAPAMSKVDAVCYILPLLPKCVDEWKAAHPMAAPAAAAKKVAAVTTKTAVKATTTTMNMMAMPKCTPAPAGSGYLYVCK